MYVYIESEHNAEGSLWTVGFYSPDGQWHPESDHDKQESAANRVAWLNGSKQEVLSDSGSREEYQNFKRNHGGIE